MIDPTDADFDDMHHALGRPQSSTMGTYRNHYCVERNSETAKRFEELGWWDFCRTINDGRDAVYSVNGVGKLELEKWMVRK